MLNNKSIVLLGTLAISNFAHAALNDTGIKTCSNATQNGLPCPVAGFPGQDAEFGTNSFNYTKIDANGNAMPVTATNHTCVQDNVTGLMWEVKTDDGGLRDKDNTYTFDEAETFAANVNATNLCGHNDWRVPEIKELASIVDYSISFAYSVPTIDEDYFPNTPTEWFWSASPNAYHADSAWVVDFKVGNDGHGSRTDAGRARLVCAGQSLSFVFIDNANGTITDSTTGLIWAKCPLGQSGTNCEIGSASALTWAQALNAAKDSTLAGRNDWRVPNIQELRSIVDYTKYYPSINSTYFPNTPAEWFWSASPYADFADSTWVVDFYSGDDDYYGRYGTSPARLVCAGQVLSFALNVAKAGNGAGSVLSNPAGINCGSDCTENFAKNAVVTLTATPTAGSTFANWGGACSSSTNHLCTVTMDADKSATATFNLAPTAPVVSTDAPSVITASSATLKGTVNPKGAVTTPSFDFGLITAYGTNIAATPASIAATAGATAVSANKTGLSCGTVYHYRIKAVNSKGTTLGPDKAFTTATCVPDFAVTGITVTPTSPLINTAFSVAVTVKNLGAVNGDGGQLRLWLNQATAQTCAATGGDKNLAVGSIAAGATKTLTFTGLNLATVATRTLQVLVDATCAKVETSETNNRLTKSYRTTGTRQADLLVTAITLTPTTPGVNSNFSAAVTVKNQGNNAVTGVYLDVWANQATTVTCGKEGEAWIDVGAVAAGATKTVMVNGIPAGVAGAKTLRAFIDSWCEIAESNEANNQMTKAYSVQ